jgi:hypothetical protein
MSKPSGESLIPLWLSHSACQVFILEFNAICATPASTASVLDINKIHIRVRVRQLIREGKIEAHNLGRDYAISADALSKVVVYRKPGRPPASKKSKKSGAKKSGSSA